VLNKLIGTFPQSSLISNFGWMFAAPVLSPIRTITKFDLGTIYEFFDHFFKTSIQVIWLHFVSIPFQIRFVIE
jgi:hypothetical protein